MVGLATLSSRRKQRKPRQPWPSIRALIGLESHIHLRSGKQKTLLNAWTFPRLGNDVNYWWEQEKLSPKHNTCEVFKSLWYMWEWVACLVVKIFPSTLECSGLMLVPDFSYLLQKKESCSNKLGIHPVWKISIVHPAPDVGIESPSLGWRDPWLDLAYVLYFHYILI